MDRFISFKGLINSCVAFILVLAAVLLVSAGLESNMDIRFYDESYYLTQGRFWPVNTWEADYSPLYSLYYKGLSLFDDDPIRLYYLNYRVWAGVFGLCAFGVLRSFGASVWLCWIWSVLAVYSELCFPLWPKAGHLAMAGVSVALIGFQRLGKDKFAFFSLSTLWLFLLSWARPEFFLGGFVGLVFIILWWWRGGLSFIPEKEQKENNPPKPILIKVLLISAVSLIAFFLVLWGLPVGRSGRGAVAFGQHFVHNWYNIQGKKGDLLYDWVNWREIFSSVFGKAEGIFSALLANPLAMVKHFWFNFKYLGYNAFVLFSETLFTHRIFHVSIALMVTGVLAFCEWFHHFNGLSICFSRGFKFIKTNGLYLLPLAIPSLVAGLLFQPRPHYILPLLPFFWAFAARLSTEYSFPKLERKFKLAFGSTFLATAFLFMPDNQAFFKVVANTKENEKEKDRKSVFEVITCKGLQGKALVQKLQAMNQLKGKRVFDGSTGVLDYLGTDVIRRGKIGFEMDYDRLKPLSQFLEREKIEVIYLAESMKYDRFFEKDSFWLALKARPEVMGWEKQAIPESKDSLLIRR